MDQEVKESKPSGEPNLFLQWGSRKRLRCVKSREDGSPSPARSDALRRTIPRVNRPLLGGDVAQFRSPRRPSTLHRRKSEAQASEARQSISLSPEKDRYYSTRGSPFPFEGNGFDFSGGVEEKGTAALPRFFISLSNKEKEEDFLAMKGCKLPQRPKKRPKLMQKCLLTVCPGAWLSDLSHERYEVREKKSSKKQRARGLKALCMESDSE
ncbi:hypothetical protein CFC21_074245 [Triticum aestivum]|uniref:Uncharacterized protein n=4 Tax=Triticum TaxID=4564 RepID=A0A9R0XLF2_TRITD|nr:uncharacterized protein LOC119312363 isoform X1 [Triticum dicoccoides]XP_037443987.1 uncharacterized protein LOC119312363 isoform X1 [Triticum dicoccoides]XP_044391093.1 uncharacterized protein LOC123113845 isoform X1 [Triticum aestivum]XP_044391094.1 uncharacterized protein LOC123113845 isoform X1 [Triticum aestivum]XP_048532293.1 uncharacterized protein LOC125511056 isoform X1 [Triticum urartu]VAI38598.1 unnamed protein product [Triticum turgidum subsp. durum]KAF7068496.1 hypothetical pr